jgi:hypothetical protein
MDTSCVKLPSLPRQGSSDPCFNVKIAMPTCFQPNALSTYLSRTPSGDHFLCQRFSEGSRRANFTEVSSGLTSRYV